MLNDLIGFIRDHLLLSVVRDCPEELMGNVQLELLLKDLTALRTVLFAFSKGNSKVEIELKGFMAGCLKQLQAHLRHLEWHLDQVSVGDFNQRVDFMGPMSESFNNMADRLSLLIRQLEEKEGELCDLAVELKLEIEARKQKEEQLRQSEERWKLAIACSLDGIWDVDLKTGECYCSPRFLDILHADPASPISHRWDLWMHPDDVTARKRMQAMLLKPLAALRTVWTTDRSPSRNESVEPLFHQSRIPSRSPMISRTRAQCRRIIWMISLREGGSISFPVSR